MSNLEKHSVDAFVKEINDKWASILSSHSPKSGELLKKHRLMTDSGSADLKDQKYPDATP